MADSSQMSIEPAHSQHINSNANINVRFIPSQVLRKMRQIDQQKTRQLNQIPNEETQKLDKEHTELINPNNLLQPQENLDSVALNSPTDHKMDRLNAVSSKVRRRKLACLPRIGAKFDLPYVFMIQGANEIK